VHTCAFHRYDQQRIEPLFEFGAGMSYTTFALSGLNVTSREGGVSATLINTGKTAGATVAQLYVGFPAAAGEPPQQLKGFRKAHLEPGEATTVKFDLSSRDVSTWSVAGHAWVEAKGEFRVWVGLSSRDPHALTGSFMVD
jgi:beta-glucosidase